MLYQMETEDSDQTNMSNLILIYTVSHILIFVNNVSKYVTDDSSRRYFSASFVVGAEKGQLFWAVSNTVAL